MVKWIMCINRWYYYLFPSPYVPRMFTPHWFFFNYPYRYLRFCNIYLKYERVDVLILRNLLSSSKQVCGTWLSAFSWDFILPMSLIDLKKIMSENNKSLFNNITQYYILRISGRWTSRPQINISYIYTNK